MISSGCQRPDLAGDVETQLAGVLELAVLVPEEPDVAHPEHPGRVPLLVLSHRDEALSGDRAIPGALAAIGDDGVRDVRALPRQRSDRAARAELWIVGMRGYDEHTLRSAQARGGQDVKPVTT